MLAALAGLFSPRATAASVVLVPGKDTTIYGNGDTSLSNGAGDSLFVGKNGRGRVVRTLLAFPLADRIPAGATIDSVTLTLAINTRQHHTQTVEPQTQRSFKT